MFTHGSRAAPVTEQATHAVLEPALKEIDSKLAHLEELSLRQLQIAGLTLRERILADHRYDDPLRLERFGWTVYSQNEEDGILAEIFRRIGTANRKFLEFGVQRGLESNTLNLLEQEWSGAWIEGVAPLVSEIERGFRRWIASGRLAVRAAIVTRENINDLIRDFSLPRDLDLLSIDIDGNDYHVWEAITQIEPRVVLIEYNGKFPPPMQWIMAYDPRHHWEEDDQFGASLESMTALGRSKGYSLVGCNITGTNAFFVQSRLAEGRFAQPADASALYQPARYYLLSSFAVGHRPGFSRSQVP
jgi:hypothetical protein